MEACACDRTPHITKTEVWICFPLQYALEPFFSCIQERTVPNYSLYLFMRNKNILEKVFPPYTCSFKPCPIFSSQSNLFSYLQSLSVKFLLASFLSITDKNCSGCLHENLLLWFCGTYFLGGPVWVWLGVLSRMAPSFPPCICKAYPYLYW